MRRAIIHIGWPRTGTTSLQFLLHRHRAALLAQRVLYPDLTPRPATTPHLSHQHLGETLDGRRPRAERGQLLRRLDAALAQTAADTVVLSYEGLAQLRHAGPVAETLATLFLRRGFSPEILATLKPQAAFLNSAYTWRCQFLLERRPFAGFALASLGDHRLDYARVLAPWARAAAGRVRVLPVRDRADPAPLLARTLAAMGIAERLALPPEELTRRENRSPGPVAVAASRALRASGAARALGAQAREAGRWLEYEAAARGLDAEPFHGLTPDLAAQVTGRFATANEAFARQVWGLPWAMRVAAEPAPEANEIVGDDPAPEAIAAAVLRRYGLVQRGPLARLGLGWRRGAAEKH